jgi:hypothetical protein
MPISGKRLPEAHHGGGPNKKIVIFKHTLSNVQEGKDLMPFSKKIDEAMDFIDQIFAVDQPTKDIKK